jgi:DNA helicase HerA-like ATPase
MNIDEMETGFPRMTIGHIYDVIRIIAAKIGKEQDPPIETKNFDERKEEIKQIVAQLELPANVISWRALLGRVGRVKRLGIFDTKGVEPPNYTIMLQRGQVSIIDLSDTDSPQVNNLVIAQILRGIQRQQDTNYREATESGKLPTPAMVFIEEAHEFLSAERIKHMPVLFQQVARIARRGRKRWLGLVFITQLPQHVPDEVLGLINNWVIHKVSDANVVNRLQRSIGNIDKSLWARLPTLAPGQATVSFTSLARPLLVAIDPTPSKLLMVE